MTWALHLQFYRVHMMWFEPIATKPLDSIHNNQKPMSVDPQARCTGIFCNHTQQRNTSSTDSTNLHR